MYELVHRALVQENSSWTSIRNKHCVWQQLPHDFRPDRRHQAHEIEPTSNANLHLVQVTSRLCDFFLEVLSPIIQTVVCLSTLFDTDAVVPKGLKTWLFQNRGVLLLLNDTKDLHEICRSRSSHVEKCMSIHADVQAMENSSRPTTAPLSPRLVSSFSSLCGFYCLHLTHLLQHSASPSVSMELLCWSEVPVAAEYKRQQW